MKFTGRCPITNNIETIYRNIIHCPTFDNPDKYILGLIYKCSAIETGEIMCKNCPIYAVSEREE